MDIVHPVTMEYDNAIGCKRGVFAIKRPFLLPPMALDFLNQK
jgi:hypothetical protein